MKFVYILLGLLPLVLAKPHCECPLVNCLSGLSNCECQNTAARVCADRCGGKPKIMKCPPTATTSAAPPASTARTFCGSRGLAPCPTGQTCIANPDNLSCSLIADCPGFCVQLNGPFCGGIANFQCPAKDQVCVDDPRDDCDVQNGGADCGGTCVRLDGSSSAYETV